MLRTAIRTRALAALSVAALAVVAVACGDDDDNASNATSGGDAAAATTEGGSSAAATSPSGDATTGSSGSDSGAPSNPNERAPKDPANPVQGGTLVYGLEADTTNPWAPYNCSSATSGRDVLKTVSDALFTEDKEGKPVPLLLESVDHNADYTEWTMHVRDGITFTDGTPLDGAAVKFNIDTCLASPLTATAFAQIDHTTATGQDVTLITKSPWVSLPTRFLDYGTCSFMFSAKWLGSLANVPQRDQKTKVYDATLAATPATGDALKPVGLGAFMYKSYSPGNGNSFVAVRNPDYWRGPKGITGEQLPYLDEIDFVVAVDEDGRSNSVRSGDFDAMFTSMGDTIKQFLDDESFEVNSSSKFADTGYIMLNVATGDADPDGKNTASPLLNVDCRRALAGAIDRDRWSKERMAGVAPAANGPFPPGSLGYLEDNGYPAFDVAAAQGEMDKCLAALKTDHIEFSFNTTNDPFNVESNQLVIVDVAGRVRRQGSGKDHADRAGPIHRPRAQWHVRGLRLAQPLRQRPRRAANVVVQRGGDADRPAGSQLRALQGSRDRQGARHHLVGPGPGGPQGGRRDHQQAVRVGGLQHVADLGAVGHHLAALCPRRPGQHVARRRRRDRPRLPRSAQLQPVVV